MRVGPPENDPSWDAPLLRAAGKLGGAGGHPLLFLEEREDLRVEAGEDGVREAAHLVLRGLAGRGGRAGRFEAAIPDPSPEDVAVLARAIATERMPPPPHGGHWVAAPPVLDPWVAGETLSAIVSAARREVGAGRASIVARWVAFDQRVWVARPERGVLKDRRCGRRIRLEVRVADRETDGAAVGETVLGEDRGHGLERLALSTARRALVRVRAREAPGGEVPAVFAPGVGGILVHELAGHALEADTVRRGASALAMAKGKVAPGAVRVVDDPRRGRAAWYVDDEGERVRAVVLIEDGRVHGLLHDRRSAEAMGARPTGHGRRSSFQEPVRPRMGCTYLAPGSHDPEEALEGISRGVYVRRMEAASTDTSRGEMSFRVTDADLVHHGRLDAPLQPFRLTVIMREALSTLERIASDLAFDTCIGSCIRDGQPLATSVGAPTFRVGLTRVLA